MKSAGYRSAGQSLWTTSRWPTIRTNEILHECHSFPPRREAGSIPSRFIPISSHSRILGGDSALLRYRFMVVADYTRHLPHAILVLPQCHKLGFTESFVSLVVKAVHANLHCSISFQRIHLHRAWHNRSLDFAADVLLDRRNEGSLTD